MSIRALIAQLLFDTHFLHCIEASSSTEASIPFEEPLSLIRSTGDALGILGRFYSE